MPRFISAISAKNSRFGFRSSWNVAYRDSGFSRIASGAVGERALLIRFSIAVYYVAHRDSVEILAVMDARRDPKKWQDRV